MAKKKLKTSATVPCVKVVIGGKQGVQATPDGAGCTIVGENRGGTTKFNLGREFKATSKSVSTPKKNKPCMNALGRKGCPVQLAFDKGQPFLRFCTEEKKPGIRINVNDPKQAQAEADRMCSAWEANGKKFPAGEHQLGRSKRR